LSGSRQRQEACCFSPRVASQPRQQVVGATRFAFVAIAVALFTNSIAPTSAQEVSGLAAAAAIENAMVECIAKAEKSVVSIALVTTRGDLPRDPRVELFPQFGQPMVATLPNDPFSDPDFVPNEYATGVIIDTNGMVLTNFHAIGRDSKRYDIYVTTNDRKVFRATIKGGDDKSDLAVLELINTSPNTKFTPITFGDAKKLKKGQIVISLGNPYAIARDGQPSASWGIISNLARKIGTKTNVEEQSLHHFGTLIQTDAKLNFGTSGGALLNLKGEMIGLTTSLAATSGYEQAAGYAIPIDKEFLEIVESHKKGQAVPYGFLGILPQNLSPPEVLAGIVGMRVNMVSPGTPASRAKLLQNDLITHVNGRPIHDASGLRLSVGLLRPGDVAKFTVERNGRPNDIDVKLSKSANPGAKIVTSEPAAWRGVHVDYPTAVYPRIPLSEELDASSVAVSDVEEGSPAHRANLHRGMLITHVGNVATPVPDPETFYREVAKHSGDVDVWVSAPGHTGSVTVKAE
jgi:S1-C subfamily serine protease